MAGQPGDDPATVCAPIAGPADAIISFSNDERIVAWNAGAVRLFGYSAQEMVGRELASIVPDDRGGEFWTNLSQAFRDGATDEIEVEQRQRDGKVRDLTASFFRLGPPSPVEGWGVLIKDVTAQKQAASNQREAEHRLREALEAAPVAVIAVDKSGVLRLVSGGLVRDVLPGDEPLTVGQSLIGMRQHRPRVIEIVERGLAGEAFAQRLELGGRYVDVTVTPEAGDAQGGFIAVIVDVTLEQRAEQVAEHIRGIHDLDPLSGNAAALPGQETLSSLLHRIAVRARELTNADFAAISVFGEGGHLDRFIYDGMSDSDARRLGSPPVGRGLLGALAGHSSPIRLDDLTEHPRYTGWPEGHPDMCAFLGVPVRSGQETIGSLYMTRTRGHEPFTEADEFSATMLSLQIAVGVATALAHERASRLALLEERISIGQDLHDGTIQTLYALALQNEAAVDDPDLDGETLRDLLKMNVGRLNAAIADIRSYIEALQSAAPGATPELTRDLADVVERLVPGGVDVIVNVTAPALQELSARVQEDFLFIAREAVSNAVRHGEPTKIAIDLRQTGNETALTIQDNGRGFDQFNFTPRLGTHTIRNRAERLGATLTVVSLPGMGTTVRVTLPRHTEEE
jgi:PAS domain S-box-containing protein